MLFRKRLSKFANIVIEDNVVRIVLSNDSKIEDVSLLIERALPSGLIEEGKIKNELEFYNIIDEIVRDYSLKKYQVRFYAPTSLVVMRQVDLPQGIADDELKSHFEMEIGESLHLPFEEPILDIHPLQGTDENIIEDESASQDIAATKEEERVGILFAASGEEIIRYTQIFEDVGMEPVAVDVQAIGNYRYFYHMELPPREYTYLFFEFNMCSVNISIFYNHQLEFLRYHQLDFNISDWVAEDDTNNQLKWNIVEYKEDLAQGIIETEIEELSRIMNFYRYSQHQGTRDVKEIVVHGDFPYLDRVIEKMNEAYELPVKLLEGKLENGKLQENNIAFVPALGLVLKGSEE